MKTGKNCRRKSGHIRLLVLVPHRDTRLLLQTWGASLYAAGAGLFPWVMPLARLKRPLSDEELKGIARTLRQWIDSEGGKLTAGPPAYSALPIHFEDQAVSLFGPSFSIELPDDFFEELSDAITRRISPFVLGAALVSPGSLPENFPAPPEISFRAGALAIMNCRFRPFGDDRRAGYLFEWTIEALKWLPKRIE